MAVVAVDNPFVTFPGRVPARFGGRGATLTDARAVLGRLEAGANGGEHIFEGLRGMGKTALMAHIRTLAVDRGLAAVAVELGEGSDAAVYRALQRTWRDLHSGAARQVAERLRGIKAGPVAAELAAPDEDGPVDVAQLVGDIGVAAAAAGVGVLVTVDEAHEDPELACQIIRGLHAVGQANQPVAAYLAGLPGTHQRLSEVTTYAERILVTELDVLDNDGVRQALAGPCRDLGVLVDDRVVDVVIEQSGGYPYFVQVWGHHLWQVADGDDEIDLDHLDRAQPRVAEGTARLFVGRWRRLTGRQRDYMSALAAAGGTGRSSSVAKAIGLTVNTASQIRAELLDMGMVYAPSYGHVATSIPGFAEWITTQS